MSLIAPRQRGNRPSNRLRSARGRRSRRAVDRAPMLAMLAGAATAGLAAGTLLEFFLDPRSGRRRRHTAGDRVRSRARRGEHHAVVRARRAESRALGLARRTINSRRRPQDPVDDVELAHKVETEMYRHVSAAKGQISVNAEEGVVFLRGTMSSPADILLLGDAVRDIAGVNDVENLLHMPGTPAPPSRTKLERERSPGHDAGVR